MRCPNCNNGNLYLFNEYLITYRKITSESKVSKKIFHKDVVEGIECSKCKCIFDYKLDEQNRVVILGQRKYI